MPVPASFDSEPAARRWHAWFTADGPVARTELARYVYAARELLPARIASTADGALSALRSEIDTVSSARLQAFERSGYLGPSGFDATTPRMRAAAAALAGAFGIELDTDAPVVEFDRFVTRCITGDGAALDAPVAAFRRALGRALEAVSDPDEYGVAAATIHGSARGVFDALCGPRRV